MKRYFLFLIVCMMTAMTAVAQLGPTKQNRGLFAFIDNQTSEKGTKVGWRMRATDDPYTTRYKLYFISTSGKRTLIGTYTTKTWVSISSVTAYTADKGSFAIYVYDKDNKLIDSQEGVKADATAAHDIALSSPCIKDPVADTAIINYDPQDASAFDMDGDGEQEIILKWNNRAGTTYIGTTNKVTALWKNAGSSKMCMLPAGLRVNVKNTEGSSWWQCYVNGKDTLGNDVRGLGYIAKSALTTELYQPNEFIDCYKLDGTRLWRINMGQNTNVGNNVSMFCADFDLDGKGEIMLKTAPGTKDALGNYVGGAAHSDTGEDLPGYADSLKFTYRGSDGLPTYGIIGETNGKSYEWVTIFDGTTGAELGSHDFWPYFNFHTDWDPNGGDGAGYGRRGCDQKGAVIKIPCSDGVVRPTGCFQRGAYTYVHCTDYSWDGKKLKEEWRNYSSTTTGTKNSSYREKDGVKTYSDKSLFAQGAHPSESSDLDGDGYDELMIGAAALDHDGTVLWSTGLGHGDAVAVGDLNPEHPGIECWRITEVGTKYDACMMDGATGEIMNGQLYTTGDVARGCVIDIDSAYVGSEYFHNARSTFFDCNGNTLYKYERGDNTGYPNYRIFWDGDLLDEHFSGTCVSKFSMNSDGVERNSRYNYPGSAMKFLYALWPVSSINSTKENPCLQCDLYGDFREELVMYTEASNSTAKSADGPTDYVLRILSSTFATDKKLPWLRDDNCYNMQILSQNIGYSQPPHLGYNAIEYDRALRKNAPVLKFTPKENTDYYVMNESGAKGIMYLSGNVSSSKIVNTNTEATMQFVYTAKDSVFLIKSNGNYLADDGTTGFKYVSSSSEATPYLAIPTGAGVVFASTTAASNKYFSNSTLAVNVGRSSAANIYFTIVSTNGEGTIDEPTGISPLVYNSTANAVPTQYYSIDGRKLSKPQKGLNIVRYSNGVTRKVMY